MVLLEFQELLLPETIMGTQQKLKQRYTEAIHINSVVTSLKMEASKKNWGHDFSRVYPHKKSNIMHVITHLLSARLNPAILGDMRTQYCSVNIYSYAFHCGQPGLFLEV